LRHRAPKNPQLNSWELDNIEHQGITMYRAATRPPKRQATSPP
jgi:hypothetical protein